MRRWERWLIGAGLGVLAVAAVLEALVVMTEQADDPGKPVVLVDGAQPEHRTAPALPGQTIAWRGAMAIRLTAAFAEGSPSGERSGPIDSFLPLDLRAAEQGSHTSRLRHTGTVAGAPCGDRDQVQPFLRRFPIATPATATPRLTAPYARKSRQSVA